MLPLRLYGGAAFERVMHGFHCAAYSIECPPVSREKVANILLAHASRGGGRGVTEAAAEIARSWLAPLLDTACDRLAFVLRNLFDLAIERTRNCDSECGRKSGNMDGYSGFHAALRQAHNRFIKELAKQRKQLVRHHLDSVTSPHSLVCYGNDFQRSFGSSTASSFNFNHPSVTSLLLELSDATMKDQKRTHTKQLPQKVQIPETPSPDQPCDGGLKKDLGNGIDIGARKRISRMTGNDRNPDNARIQQNGGSLLFGNADGTLKSATAYTEICLSAAQHFGRIREVLIERNVASALL
ncbi:hypothetical protein FF2_007545 [Malus domestica]